MALCVFSISCRIQGPIEKIISAQCCIAVRPENITKPLDFLISECIVYSNATLGRNGLTLLSLKTVKKHGDV